jgi:hypothetical protein
VARVRASGGLDLVCDDSDEEDDVDPRLVRPEPPPLDADAAAAGTKCTAPAFPVSSRAPGLVPTPHMVQRSSVSGYDFSRDVC